MVKTSAKLDFLHIVGPHYSIVKDSKGAFTNYVYKRRGVGGQKYQLLLNFYTIENVNGGG